ncbi:MAG TPA: ATP-dependent Clp protease ATP-binding subunit [Candidatus Stercoripulliclostridium merdigallinarum]|uniref:ATP-dependent Clp protease ATP-binding subunit n=1 Tax=Candidatus Stercoripulliclostridium merdigallinarum TaxID=2840951 RepID=A0A9D1SIJ7_9FIRM|nr:ATP-dependent Clp protease ATP-binding subunit [Candidatus Stercoripulliclostridium merdigallinarum]
MPIGYTSDVRKVMLQSRELANRAGSQIAASEYVLGALAVVEGTYAFDIFTRLKVDKSALLNEVMTYVNTSSDRIKADQVKRALSYARTVAEKMGYDLYDTQHLLLALSWDINTGAAKILEKFHISFADLKPIVESMSANGIGKNEDEDDAIDLPTFLSDFFSKLTNGNAEVVGPVQESFFRTENTPPKNEKRDDDLNEIGIDLTERAKQGAYDPVIGREKEIDMIMRVLTRRTKNNPVLIGEPGVGKTAVVEGLAQAIVKGEVPDLLKNKRIFGLDVGSLVAGTKFRGEFEERFKNMLKRLNDGKTILFIDEMHMIMTTGSNDESGTTVANLIKPVLARGEIPTIGATTMDEYRKHIEKDAALARRFKPIIVDPPSVEETIKILEGLRPRYEDHHKVKITDGALKAAAELSDRYIADRFLPDKAIDVIDEAASKMRVASLITPPEILNLEKEKTLINDSILQATKNEDFVKAGNLKKERDEINKNIRELREKWGQDLSGGMLTVDEEAVAGIVSEWTGVPVNNLTEEESKRLMNLEEELKKRVIGQDEAVSAVARAIKRARAGLKDPKKPIGTFMFLGPTGVGKTELSKALAEKMFGNESMLIRIDMSEYMEKINVSRLIGSAPGYVGYEEGGQLTEKVRRKPYSVVLFDEIEKAHPDVFNLLLQVLDDGQLTDSHGRTVSFKNTIIIMTSNIGAKDIAGMKRVGFGGSTKLIDNDYEAMKEKQMEALKQAMNPEFINRIDDIIIFRRLDEASLSKIAAIMMNEVIKQLADKDIHLKYTDAVTKYLLENGTDLEYGARPLRRAVQRVFEDKLSDEIISGRIRSGSNVLVDVVDGEIRFNLLDEKQNPVQGGTI